MAKKKPAPFKLIRGIKVGTKGCLVKVEETEENGARRFRTWCRRARVQPEDKIRDHDSWEEAITFANKISDFLRRGKVKHGGKIGEVDDHTLSRLKTIWVDFQAAQIMGQKIPPMSYGVQHVEQPVTLERVIECGVQAIKTVNKVNEVYEKEGIEKLDFLQFMNNFRRHSISSAAIKSHIKMKLLIEELKKHKLGKHGGKGNRELEPASKKEWATQLDRLNLWIGGHSLEGNHKEMVSVITTMINMATIPKGKRNAGQPLAPRTKEHIADKASQFGRWLVQEDYWTKNHFARLQSDFKFDDEREVTTFTPAEVKALFDCATKPTYLDMIPYLSFLFYAGCRPQEIGDPNVRLRRFPWEWMDGWRIKSDVTGGVLFNVKVFRTINGKKQRISKWKKNREADMHPCGVAWIKWWSEQKGMKELPTKGDVPFDRPVWEKLRKEAQEAGLKKYWDEWEPDAPRHSFTSYAHWNRNFKVVEDYWLRKCGHRESTYNKHYDKKMMQEDVDAYFSIMPPKKNNPAPGKAQG